MSTRWTEEREKALRTLWSHGAKLEAIGETLGVSRAAVIGKAHRMGLPARRGASAQRNVPEPRLQAPWPVEKPTPRPRPARRVDTRQPKDGLESAGATTLLRHVAKYATRTPSSHKRCQFIEGEPTADDACKCGAKTLPGSPYCPAHHARCYMAAPRKEVA